VRVDLENVSNGSAVEALWALGALEPKKWVKRPDVRVGVWWKGCRKQLPKRRFLPPFTTTGTETYAV
jgi:hypothetical protein